MYERLGDVRSRAVTLGKIADILAARGEQDEALRIRREEELPVYERLGDVRPGRSPWARSPTSWPARGERTRPCGSAGRRSSRCTSGWAGATSLSAGATLAITLLIRNTAGDREEARGLLCLALADARRMQLPEAAADRGDSGIRLA